MRDLSGEFWEESSVVEVARKGERGEAILSWFRELGQLITALMNESGRTFSWSHGSMSALSMTVQMLGETR